MKKTAFISDLLFTFFTGFCLSLCFFRYRGIAILLSFTLALLCGALLLFGVGSYLSSKRKSFFLKRSDEAQKQRLLTHLSLLTDEKKTALFQQVFACEDETKIQPLCIRTSDCQYFLRFHFSPVTADEIAVVFRTKTQRRKIVLCDRMEESATLLAHSVGVEYKTAEEVYLLVKERNALPERYLGENSAECKRKKLFRLCFSKSSSKRFFISGILLLFTSFITPFSYYYILFGALLLIASALLRIFGHP